MAKRDLNSEILSDLKLAKLDQESLVIGAGFSLQLGKSGISFAYAVSGAQSAFDYVNGNYVRRFDFSNDYGYGAIYANAPAGTFPVTVLTSKEGIWYFYRINSASENVGENPPVFMTSLQTGSPVGGNSLWNGYSNVPQSSFRVDTDFRSVQAATLRYNSDAQQIEFAPRNGEFAKLQNVELGEVISVSLVDLIRGFSVVHNLGDAYVRHFSIWPPPASIQFNVNSIIVGPNPDAASKISTGVGFVSFDGSAQSQLQEGTMVLEELTVTGDTSTYYNVNGTYLRSSDQTGQNWTRNTGGGFAFGYLKMTSHVADFCSLHQYSNNSSTTRYYDISNKATVIDQPWTAVLMANKYNRDSNTWEHITPVPAEAVITNGSLSSTTLQATVGEPWNKLKVSGLSDSSYNGVYTRTSSELFGGPDNFIQYSNGTRYLVYLVNLLKLIPQKVLGQSCRWVFCDKIPYDSSDYVVAAASEQTLQWPGVAAELKWFADVSESSELQLVIEEQQSETLQISGSSITAMNGLYDPVDEEATGDARIWSNGAYQVKKDASGRWTLSAASLSLYDVSGAADPWSGVYAMEDSEGNLIDCTIEVQYQTFTSKKLMLPTTALPNKVQVIDGGSTSVFTIASAQSSAHPTNGDSWVNSASGSSLHYSNFRWEYLTSEGSVYSDWTLQWPDAANFSSIEVEPYESDAITMSGLTSSQGYEAANGNYFLVDSTKTGTERIWKHESQEFYVRNVYSQWVLTDSATSTSYNVYVQDYNGNNYQAPWDEESGDSYVWYYQGSQLSDVEFCPDTAGFTSAVDVIKCDADLKGRYILVGYRTITADGGFEELVYRKADNGSKLVWDGSKWTLYGPDFTDWYVTSGSDQLRYPQDQNLTWEVGVAGEGSDANLPLIVAVPGEAKLPRPDKTVLTVAGAGIADVNGTYNPVDGVDAFGSSMIWLKSDGTYKIWCNNISGVVAYWLLGEADSITGKYLLFDPPTADGAISGPYNEDGSSKTWEVGAGSTAPAPTVTAVIVKDTITLSGASPDAINGTYELVDDSAEGDERIWTNGTYFVARGTSYTVWMVRNIAGRPSNPGAGGVYFYGSDTSKSNPYNDDGTSYDWYQMNGSGTLQVVKG